ncbi:Methylated-DNA-[protein]-cysteine S-methyltransferase, DNA binding protein [Metarhizium album ARSEF 1941]|uniref:Methylated-DNA-[protein]-cysteine S-methyltransferase, DNA binding protein n=1 Tax=Metarhizium album (strain ARSEF 1941) TaxID=1081103 RepID=A0A0B2WPY3_METAS|nr:Methylated-DNA-[protein]-cysteine S-methyltransferase, DNA binding protein [Metarhizium album ARSEF 1941]KHN95547.1 Methylated-DNA-[protein]-cysteine S-methyltransferase, DNA binding protein [Metarhizium album ARSEF 1941]
MASSADADAGAGAGAAQRPRQVGTCFNTASVPWQRVINARGFISPRSRPDGAREQAEALGGEGVRVVRGAVGELAVDVAEFGWFPDVLPSERACARRRR